MGSTLTARGQPVAGVMCCVLTLGWDSEVAPEFQAKEWRYLEARHLFSACRSAQGRAGVQVGPRSCGFAPRARLHSGSHRKSEWTCL